MKKRDLVNLLNRGAAAIEAFANAQAIRRKMKVLTSTEIQELIEDLYAAASDPALNEWRAPAE